MFQSPRPPKPETSEALDRLTATETGAETRRPRIAIMGEFSAGKSTLTNLLMGDEALPVRVTATQLPPVWLSLGDAAPYGVGLDGGEFGVNLDRPETVPLETTRHISVARQAEVLQLCDLIDFPGISDPNMPAEVWDRAAPLADGVLWCTHATQAWRQSEAAFWEEMPERLRANAFLLVTRFDKLGSERDRARVLARVRRETDGLFAGVFPVSLTRAIAAGEDAAAFEESGAADLMEGLLDLVTRVSRDVGRDIPLVAPTAPPYRPDGDEAPSAIDPLPAGPPTGLRVLDSDGARAVMAERSEAAHVPSGRIVPRRVRASHGATRKRRPTLAEAEAARAEMAPPFA
ncbi:MAG: hypothetical protein AAFR52_00820 [Pseudomonadota bacterium]